MLPEIDPASARLRLGPGIFLLPAQALEPAIVSAALDIIDAAPLRHMATPWGKPMSVAMTNCGAWGWVSDESGYRYEAADPLTGRPWPEMPPIFRELAAAAAGQAGFPDFAPDACLVNRYDAQARMGLHHDRDERDFDQPIVSVSLGVGAIFRVGGLRRGDPTRSHTLRHGDIIVFGGPARLIFHGIDRLSGPPHPRLGPCRINLTFRRAG